MNLIWSRRLVLLAVGLATIFGSTFASAEDWPYWRGPRMNGQSAETGLPHDWDPKGGIGSNLLWKREDLGTRSSPVVFNDRVYLLARHNQETDREQEKVVCLDARSGDTLWEQPFSVYLSDVPDTRVAWSSPTVDPETGNVYALGVCGLFQCFDGVSGEVLWDYSMSEQFGLLTTYGGRTNFPVVFEDLVIISGVVIGWGEQAKPSHRFYAFDKSNGQVVWNNSTRPLPHDTTYSAPIISAFDGQAAMVFASGDGGVHAFQPRTGKSIWKYNVSSRGINTTPLVVGDRVYAGHPEENLDSTKMGAFFALNGAASGDLTGTENELWRTKELFVGRAAPLQIGDMLYVIDDRAKMHVLRADTGEETDTERMGTMQRSSPVLIDGYIWNIENNGRWFILKNRKDGVNVVNKGRLPRGENSDGSIAVSNGRIFIPTSGALYCVGSGEPASLGGVDDPRGIESPVADQAVAHVQVVPAESLFYPGVQQQYEARLFNKSGQFLRVANPTEVTFSFDGQGEMSNGVLSVPNSATNHSATVVAKVGANSGEGRVRVVPTLEWKFDFDGGQRVPATWVGMRYRNVVVDGPLLEELREEDPIAADAYIYLHSSLVNIGAPKLTFDNSTPAQKWTGFLDFFGKADGEEAVQSLEQAKTTFDASLQRLVDEGILGSAEITTWERKTPAGETVTEPSLVVTPGAHQPKNGVMCKIRTIPKGARSQGWLGHNDFSDYTIQADFYGYERNGALPDMGLIGQRYTLDLMGEKQQLQIRTWTPQLRMAKEAPFEWKPFTWYRLKLEASIEDGEAVLRGKAWLRGKVEPKDWLLEARDSIPNTQGSPGVFGNAKTSEILVDNIIVTKPKVQAEAEAKARAASAAPAPARSQNGSPPPRN